MPVVTPFAASIETVKAVPMLARVVLDLRPQAEPIADLARERHADQAARLARHEIDRLGRDVLGQHREVALVLARGVVDEDDHLPLAEVGEDLGDGGDRHGRQDSGRGEPRRTRLAGGIQSDPPW